MLSHLEKEGKLHLELKILNHIISGSKGEMLAPFAEEISTFIAKDLFCQTTHVETQVELLQFCQVIIQRCGVPCPEIEPQIFKVIITVLALADSNELKAKCEGNLFGVLSLCRLKPLKCT